MISFSAAAQRTRGFVFDDVPLNVAVFAQFVAAIAGSRLPHRLHAHRTFVFWNACGVFRAVLFAASRQTTYAAVSVHGLAIHPRRGAAFRRFFRRERPDGRAQGGDDVRIVSQFYEGVAQHVHQVVVVSWVRYDPHGEITQVLGEADFDE